MKVKSTQSNQVQVDPVIKRHSSKNIQGDKFKNMTGMSQDGNKKHISASEKGDDLCNTQENASVQKSCCGPNSSCSIF